MKTPLAQSTTLCSDCAYNRPARRYCALLNERLRIARQECRGASWEQSHDRGLTDPDWRRQRSKKP